MGQKPKQDHDTAVFTKARYCYLVEALNHYPCFHGGPCIYVPVQRVDAFDSRYLTFRLNVVWRKNGLLLHTHFLDS